VPTARDPTTSLALSSRNAYLTPHERQHVAPVLYAALQAGKAAWKAGQNKGACIARAHAVIEETALRFKAGDEPVKVQLDYVEMNDPETFDVLQDVVTRGQWGSESGKEDRPVLLSGAMWVGRTRLIDNVVLGDARSLGVVD